MPRKRAISQELGENLVAALAATEPGKVPGVIRDWTGEHSDGLQAMVLDALNGLAEHWENYAERKGPEVAERAFQGFRNKVNDKLYRMIVSVELDYDRDEYGHTIKRNPVEIPEASPSYSAGEDWDFYGDHVHHGGRLPSDNRSDSLNPTSGARQASVDNRSNQTNPNNPAHKSSRR